MKARGFTLIELLVTVTLLAVILAVAVPSFNDASVRSRVSDNANRLASSAAFARGEAIKRNGPVVLCTSTDGASCAGGGSWEQGWIAFHDANRNGDLDAGEPVLLQEGTAPGGYRITGINPADDSEVSTLVFSPTGVGSTPGRFTVCRESPSVHPQQRQVEMSLTGRASVTKNPLTPCT